VRRNAARKVPWLIVVCTGNRRIRIAENDVGLSSPREADAANRANRLAFRA
jgi:hypothetical protein